MYNLHHEDYWNLIMIEQFDAFFKEFCKTPWAKSMHATVEDSPWHRESSVLAHTQMCIDFYKKNIASQRTPQQQLITLVALAMHDLGKPDAEETLEKKDGSGKYRRYAGHEQISANEFISFWCQYRELAEPFMAETNLSWSDIQAIKFMIQHHLPYGLKNPLKRENLKLALQLYLGSDEICFYDMLLSDSSGRISDNHEEKLSAVDDWITNFKEIKVEAKNNLSNGQIVLLIGPDSENKSKYIHNLARYWGNNIIAAAKWQRDYDAIYLKGQPTEKYKQERTAFIHASGSQFIQNHIANNAPNAKVWVNAPNLTKKSRAMWVELAKVYNLKVVTVEFYDSEKAIYTFNATTHVKQNSETQRYKLSQSLRHQLMSQDVPQLGSECAETTVVEPWHFSVTCNKY